MGWIKNLLSKFFSVFKFWQWGRGSSEDTEIGADIGTDRTVIGLDEKRRKARRDEQARFSELIRLEKVLQGELLKNRSTNHFKEVQDFNKKFKVIRNERKARSRKRYMSRVYRSWISLVNKLYHEFPTDANMHHIIQLLFIEFRGIGRDLNIEENLLNEERKLVDLKSARLKAA